MSTTLGVAAARKSMVSAADRFRLDGPHGSPLHRAVDQALHFLLNQQRPDGHWVAELQGDTILESEYILLMAFLERELEPRPLKAANYIREQQRPGGAWSSYPGGPVDVNVSVKAYFALKLAGHAADEPFMVRARELILQAGGAIRCNSFSKFYLALLGQFNYANCASVPPEMMFLPTWAYINLYAMSAWTRTIVVPLSIFSALKPVRIIPADRGCAELFLEKPMRARWPHTPTRRLLTWTNCFLGIDWLFKQYERLGPQWLRRRALAKSVAWMLEHFQDSDGVGAIFPPIIYTVICLRCLGYADDSPEMKYALRQLDDLMIEEGSTLRVQPCFSPVWDTALAMNALAFTDQANPNPGEAKVAEARPTRSFAKPGNSIHQALGRAARWLIDREVRRPGDWSLLNPGLEPAGWFFEYRNGFFPDTDDTAMVLTGLARSGQAWEKNQAREQWHTWAEGQPTPRVPIPAVARGLRWLLAMQNDDGGWAAFDRNINRELLTQVPFADHNAMLDPSCPDITARALEALGQYGYRVGHPAVDRGLRFIAQTQDRRGCWIGRWGVNYLYGTWQVLQGLEAIGHDMKQPMVRRAVAWLQEVQQPCGGWGESCATYDDPRLAGQGQVTASQTGWALLGLIAAGEGDQEAVERGIEYLLDAQAPDGSWDEDQFTGTGFPRVFYLKYHNYRVYFPLMALARYQRLHPDCQLPYGPRWRQTV